MKLFLSNLQILVGIANYQQDSDEEKEKKVGDFC